MISNVKSSFFSKQPEQADQGQNSSNLKRIGLVTAIAAVSFAAGYAVSQFQSDFVINTSRVSIVYPNSGMVQNGSTFQGQAYKSPCVGEGKGVFVLPNGSMYQGECVDHIPHGQGIFKSPREEYKGEFRKGLFNGQGIQTWVTGDTYEGSFKNSKTEGQGTYKWADGSIYQGSFKDGLFEGQGTLTLADGTKYEGSFKENKAHGVGILNVKNLKHDAKYDGAFKDGKAHGSGTLSIMDVSIENDLFEHGYPEKKAVFANLGKNLRESNPWEFSGVILKDKYHS
jgi:hypothetical protein